jgi:hypothetical protein
VRITYTPRYQGQISFGVRIEHGSMGFQLGAPALRWPSRKVRAYPRAHPPEYRPTWPIRRDRRHPSANLVLASVL